MPFNRSLTQRLFNVSKISHQTLTWRISSSASSRFPPNDEKSAIHPGAESMFHRFFHKKPFCPSAVPELPVREMFIDKLRGMDIVKDRIRLDGLIPPAPEGQLTVEDAKKLMKVAQLESVKSKIRKIGKSCVSYEEFVQICVDGCWSEDQGLEIAKLLDDSGTVIVFGKIVFLRPDQVAKAMQCLMPVPVAHPNDPRRKELEKMERHKSIIDKKAASMVRTELWCGLGFLVVQTAGFMRLTFWELTWDVMEPICFYLTSVYFMAGYAFFLRTAKEPSFEGFFESRFKTKQRKLMKHHNFDLLKYNELREACYPQPWPREKSSTFAPEPDDNTETMENGYVQEYKNIR